jgi:hypothetical protein
MRKGVSVVLALAALAFASTAIGAGGPYDSAVGAGSGLQVFGPDSFPFQFTLSAHDGPNGPSGHFTIHDPDLGTFGGDVACMQVVGNRAIAAGPLEQPVEESGFTFVYGAVAVEDNGEGTDVPDRAAPLLLFPATFARVCAGTEPLSFLGFPIDQGNVVVTDTTP